ncbi:hypothetical protein G6L63_23180 [Agrobacterium vitis]|uniref:hypothetical protein n=1 Tax=Agrobacterium vitis TaxID=373 RepID=UPI0012E8F30D|nr:hypothetical protein [Agrobacterium vitis]MUZ97352.1 hypothetical protein [Agrobacterium vitis]MVA27965.1 hypothetical protein [Agrobacterium vitis]NOJ36270.1 hypothetical protein [Agrobacterium vitis]NSZ50813.1 hypothetical protein [Agrobacterium vitis]UJL73825.1 hypothetical protein AVCG412_13965 [Agrobacterium vitis]
MLIETCGDQNVKETIGTPIPDIDGGIRRQLYFIFFRVRNQHALQRQEGRR